MESKTIPIETERLLLRKFKLDDADDMYVNYCSNPKVTEFLTWQPHKSVEDTKNFLTNVVLPSYEVAESFRWAIVLKSIGQVIGSIDVVKYDSKKHCAELGWVIGENFWGQDIMPEAAKVVINYLFKNGLVRIQAHHHVENKKSGRVMQKIGMTHEGTLKKIEFDNKGNLCDCELYAIINSTEN